MSYYDTTVNPSLSYLRNDTIRVDSKEYGRLMEASREVAKARREAEGYKATAENYRDRLDGAEKNLRFLRSANDNASASVKEQAKTITAQWEEIGNLRDLLKQSIARHHRLEPATEAYEAYNLGAASDLRITIKDTVNCRHAAAGAVRKRIVVQRLRPEPSEDTRTPAEKAVDGLEEALPGSMPRYRAKKVVEVLERLGLLRGV